jgi:hypothetical protein
VLWSLKSALSTTGRRITEYSAMISSAVKQFASREIRSGDYVKIITG